MLEARFSQSPIARIPEITPANRLGMGAFDARTEGVCPRKARRGLLHTRTLRCLLACPVHEQQFTWFVVRAGGTVRAIGTIAAIALRPPNDKTVILLCVTIG